jgi:hypothetical protein
MEQGVYEKHRKQTGPGKGDKRRPGNDDAYRQGWERIFGKKNKRGNYDHNRIAEYGR